MPAFHPRCRCRTVAVANADAECPDGNESDVPSGRVRPVPSLMTCVIACETNCARARSAPIIATFGCPVTRPIEYVANAAASCVVAAPIVWPALKGPRIEVEPENDCDTRASEG